MVTGNESGDVNYFPLDFDLLDKGDVIAAETVEAATGCKRDDPRYSLKMLGFKEQISKELRRRGRIVTIKAEDCSLRVLTDEEASEYNPRRLSVCLRQAAEAHVRNLAVDVANLSDDRRKEHERTIVVNGRLLQAVSRERKSIALECHERKTPGLTDETK